MKYTYQLRDAGAFALVSLTIAHKSLQLKGRLKYEQAISESTLICQISCISNYSKLSEFIMQRTGQAAHRTNLMNTASQVSIAKRQEPFASTL